MISFLTYEVYLSKFLILTSFVLLIFITLAVISRAKGRSSKLIIRLSVKTINGYKAIARKGNTAQEVFISTDLSKDELREIIDIYNKK